jgi:TPR repeat protein
MLPGQGRGGGRAAPLADTGDSEAQYRLELCHAYGDGGLPRDEGAAARLSRLPSDQGQVEAHQLLALFHSAGMGGLPKSDAEAVRLFRLAAGSRASPLRSSATSSATTRAPAGRIGAREAERLPRRSASRGLPRRPGRPLRVCGS